MTANAPSELFDWLVRLPNLEQSQKTGIAVTRDLVIEHRTRVFAEKDFWLCCGIVLEEPCNDLHKARFKRSHFIVRAPSKDAVLARLKDDCLYNVLWDSDNAEIEPIYSVLRRELANPPVDAGMSA